MAVMLVDLSSVATQAPATPRRWVHVSRPGQGGTRPVAVPPARPDAPTRPGGRPQGVGAPRIAGRSRIVVDPMPRPAVAARPAPAPLRLTRRGLAVVMGGFALVMLTALVVLVTAFLAIPNEPVLTQLALG